MVVEFIGSTGAGKTTVLRNVQRRLARRAATTTSADLVTGFLGLGRVSHSTAQNLIQEAIGFPFLMSSLHQHWAFIACTLKLLLRDARLDIISVNNLRSLGRKLGVYTIVRRLEGDRIILVDEGPVLAAHMFVPAFDRLTVREMARFAETLPLPDAIVHIKAPVEAVVQRTMRRSDPPREVLSRTRAGLLQYAQAAAALFDQLVAILSSVLPILAVDNPDMDEQDRQALGEAIANFIINQRLKVWRRLKAEAMRDARFLPGPSCGATTTPNPVLAGDAPCALTHPHTDAR